MGYSPWDCKSWTRFSSETTTLGRERDQMLQRLQRLCPGNEETRGQTGAFLQCLGDGCHLFPGPAPGADLLCLFSVVRACRFSG